MAKWDNMLAILWLLRSRKSMTASQIAKSLEISVRTVYRYIDTLCASGVPIVAEPGHDGGYRLMDGFKETPLFFDPAELKAMAHAALFAQGAGYPYENELNKALDKIEKHLNEEQIDYLQRHTAGFDVISISQGPSMTELLRQIEQAVADGATLCIEYQKDQTDHIKRNIDPYGLIFHRNRWYVVGYCQLRQEIRMFRVDRIRHSQPTGSLFNKPADFSIQHYLRDQSNREREAAGPMITMRMEGEPHIIDSICGHWHLRHFLTSRSDYEASFAIDRPTMEKYIPAYLIAFGKNVRVLEPKQIRDKMAETAKELARFYESG